MNIQKRDIVFCALLVIGLAPVILCAAIGLVVLPRFVMHADPPMVITRIIRTISHSTGIGTVPLMYALLMGPGVVSTLLFSAFGGRAWMVRSTLERHKEISQPPPLN